VTTDPLAEPRRVAFAGDWHANDRWAANAIRHAAEHDADVIVHLGDYGYTFTALFRRNIERHLAQHRLRLLFIDGNHDDHDLLGRWPLADNGLRRITDKAWHLPRGFRWTWGGIRFLALGGAHSVDRPYRVPGRSWWRGETLSADDINRACNAGPADVLISHDCPSGVVIPGIDDRTTPPPFPSLEIMRANEHRQLLRQVVDAVQPRAIWHGHYHVNYRQTVDLGYGPVQVTGLDCDETTRDRNVRVVDLAGLATAIAADRSAA
jgi:hypothetical protein